MTNPIDSPAQSRCKKPNSNDFHRTLMRISTVVALATSLFEKTISDYNEALKRSPDDATSYHNRGWSHYEFGQYEKAIADYNEALRFNSEFEVAYLNRGLAQYKLRQYDSGTLDYAEDLEILNNYLLNINSSHQLKKQLRQIQACITHFTPIVNQPETEELLKKLNLLKETTEQKLTLINHI